MADATQKKDADVQGVASEAKVLADILAWSRGRPKWQRDALRRLCNNGKLSDADLDELTCLCKSKGKDFDPLEENHLPKVDSIKSAVHLKAIYGVKNVNALKEEERLTFNKKGLTIIYGDNGSGKSGYARILKKVCWARVSSKDGQILPNIYKEGENPQAATIDFRVNGAKKTYHWTGRESNNTHLNSIKFFDSRAANIYVEKSNTIAYKPQPVRVLEQLAEACQHIKECINEEIRDLKNQTPEVISNPKCQPETKVGKLIDKLDGTTREREVRRLATLSEAEREQLNTLKVNFENDPLNVADQLSLLKNRLNNFVRTFELLQDIIRIEQADILTELHQEYNTAKEAATVAAHTIFKKEPLSEVGLDVWRTLWESARNYSEQHAYPDTQFPFIGDTARCVLCQQELNPDAIERFNNFENFVKNETMRKKEQAEIAYHDKINFLKNADIQISDIRSVVRLIRDDLKNKNLAKLVLRATIMSKRRLYAILCDHVREPDVKYPEAGTWPSEAFARNDANLSNQIAILRTQNESEEGKQAYEEFKELVDREWLAVIQEDVISEINRQKNISTLESLQRDVTTNRITTKSRKIAEQLVTDALRARFAEEISEFKTAGLKVELRQSLASHGKSYFQIGLMQKRNAGVDEVLSEGEHRCVALAAFFAELSIAETQSAIVFDDPISSLDQRHREVVATRIAKEGSRRQVVVFTHDIAFLTLLADACREHDAEVDYRSVIRVHDCIGFIQQDLPVRAQPINQVIIDIKTQLDNKKYLHKEIDGARWEKAVTTLLSQLRSTWERAVEEAITPVTNRLSHKVNTSGLVKVTVLTKNDCIIMREAYQYCSNWLHSQPAPLDRVVPDPDTIEKEITKLQEWIKGIKRRQNKVKLI